MVARPGRPLVISHRTNAGTMPENTLAGVAAAIADGADGVEIDVRATADGRIVLMHDETLERTAGDPRPVSSVTLAELESLPVPSPGDAAAPQPIPTLEQALDRMSGHGVLVIELKDVGIEEAVAAVVRQREAAGRCWLWAFDPAVAEAARRALPESPAALLWAPGSPDRYRASSALDAATAAGVSALSLHHSLVDAGAVAGAHARGLQVYTWTVNEPAEIRRVATAGVDAICGDYPTRITAVLAHRGA